MFSVCLSVHIWGGGGYLPSGCGGGVPTLRSGWGGYLPSQVWVGGVPTFWVGGGTYSGLDGGGYVPR